jgi:hypothetical protein
MSWRPPSARDVPDDRFDRLHEGVPAWLVPPLTAWVSEFLMSQDPMGTGPDYDVGLMNAIELAVRFDPPLPRTGRPDDSLAGILQRFTDDSPQAIDVLEFLIRHLPPHFSWQMWNENAAALKGILDAGGSVWDVTTGEEGTAYQLTRRVAGPAAAVAGDVRSVSERAGEHLNEPAPTSRRRPGPERGLPSGSRRCRSGGEAPG